MTQGTLDLVLMYPTGNWCLVKHRCRIVKQNVGKGTGTYEVSLKNDHQCKQRGMPSQLILRIKDEETIVEERTVVRRG
jgi:hypothetical protein